MLELKTAALEEEVERLQKQVVEAESVIMNQLAEIQRLLILKEENKQLSTEVKEVNQQNTELKLKLKKLEEAADDKDNRNSDETLLASMKDKLTRLNRERAVHMMREKEYVTNVKKLGEEKDQLLKMCNEAEESNKILTQQIHQLKEGLSELTITNTKIMREGVNFREFVQLKKELVRVKEENEQLKKLITKTSRHSSLPALTGTGQQGDVEEETVKRLVSEQNEKLRRPSKTDLIPVESSPSSGSWRKNLNVKM